MQILEYYFEQHEKHINTISTVIPEAFLELESWEDLVFKIISYNKMQVIVQWVDDSLSSVSVSECEKKCPVKVAPSTDLAD
jgi:hypothetical protein